MKAVENMNFKILTKNELKTLHLMAKGYDIKEIATILNVSYTTIKSHLMNIYRKMYSYFPDGNMSNGNKVKLILMYLKYIGVLKEWEIEGI